MNNNVTTQMNNNYQSVNEQKCLNETTRYDFRRNNLIFSAANNSLTIQMRIQYNRQVNEIPRNNRLLNKANTGNKTTHDLKLENNDTESK